MISECDPELKCEDKKCKLREGMEGCFGKDSNCLNGLICPVGTCRKKK